MLCKLCKKTQKNGMLHDILGWDEHSLCCDCYHSLKPKVEQYKLGKFSITTLYKYENKMKETIYLFKGCYDYELKDIFLDFYRSYIDLKYFGYYIAYAPSNDEANLQRGFNHIEAICSSLNNKKIDCFYKKSAWKQSDKSFEQRKGIKDVIGINLKGEKIKKILIVDDIITSGNTLLACANLAKKNRIKKIKLLVIAKVSKNLEI